MRRISLTFPLSFGFGLVLAHIVECLLDALPKVTGTKRGKADTIRPLCVWSVPTQASVYEERPVTCD